MKTTAVKFCALLAATITTSAFATVTIVSGDRSVTLNNAPAAVTTNSSNTTSGGYADSVNDSGGSENTATSGTADQSTDIQQLLMGGGGSGHVTGHTSSPNGLSARSFYSVTFNTDISYDWIITGDLINNLDGGSAYAYATLIDNVNFIEHFYGDKLNGFGTTPLAGSGTIPAGYYRFEIYAQANGTDGGNSFATSTFDDVFLTLTPSAVPEPASLSILAIGAAGLMMRRRKN